MDDQIAQNTYDETSGGIPLGAGVDIVQTSDTDDVEIEAYNDDVTQEGAITPEQRMRKLREQLRECTDEKRDYLDGWQRLKADFVNYKKRSEEEKGEFLKFAREGLITDIIPVLQSFQMAFANKEAWEQVDASWRMGVEHIHTQLLQILGGYGVTELDPLGEQFNPTEHTAIGTVETDDAAQYHKVAEVLQQGYKLSGKLIKSPHVKVYAERTDPHATEEPEGE